MSDGENTTISPISRAPAHTDTPAIIAPKTSFRYQLSTVAPSSTLIERIEGAFGKIQPMDLTEELDRKRKRQISEDEALARILQAEEEHALELRKRPSSSNCSSSHARSDDVLHQQSKSDPGILTRPNQVTTFKLMRVGQLPEWANSGCVTIRDVLQGEVQVALISNYMVDIQWLLSACPMLRSVPQVVIFHGESRGALEQLKAHKLPNWILYKPPLRISYGTHHSKAMFLIYRTGVRIIIHTANLIHVDWNNKSQGLWMQDFPLKRDTGSVAGSLFENDLVEYLAALEWSGCKAVVAGQGEVQVNAAYFRKYDYRAASVRIVASVPGYHNGSSLTKWGHMKLRTVLAGERFRDEFVASPIVYQFSSLGSLDEKWLSEFASSVSAGMSLKNRPLGLGHVQMVWPTVEDVRSSLEGYAAGNALPSPMKNVQKNFLQKYWARWKADHSGRSRAMPHIKTFVRYREQSITWLLLTSSNLSKAAWGALQKNSSQLMIRSYELGVCFVPSLAHNLGANSFSCTSSKEAEIRGESSTPDNTKREESIADVRDIRFVTSEWKGEDSISGHTVRLPLPYSVPPTSYDSEDVPWSWDRQCQEPDVYGQRWPRAVHLYIE